MIGLIGGTFDPIHIGHLRPAFEIAELLSLEEIRFIPSATPPHRWQPEASAKQRLEMVKLATESESIFSVDDREYRREGASYTVDTLISIRKELGNNEPICMIIGYDAFKTFTQWHNWLEILTLCHLVVSSRPGYQPEALEEWVNNRQTDQATDLHKNNAGLIYFASVTQLDISATYIRNQISSGYSSRYLTTDNVYNFIKRNKLYETK